MFLVCTQFYDRIDGCENDGKERWCNRHHGGLNPVLPCHVEVPLYLQFAARSRGITPDDGRWSSITPTNAQVLVSGLAAEHVSTSLFLTWHRVFSFVELLEKKQLACFMPRLLLGGVYTGVT